MLMNSNYTHTHTHTHTEYSLAIKRNESLPLATTWMELKGIMLSEISQTENVKQCMLSYHLSVEKQRRSHTEDKPVVTSGEWEGGRGKIGVCCGPGHSHQSSNKSWSFHGSGY